MGLIDKIKQVDISNKQLDEYMPAITMALAEMGPEEAIKRFLLLEFNRFLEYYKNAPDLNQSASRTQDREKLKNYAKSEMIGLEVNIGRKDNFSATNLISLVNRATRGPKVPLGRIHITEGHTCFEAPSVDVESLLANLNKITYGKVKVHVKLMQDALPADTRNNRDSRKKAVKH